MKKHLLFVCIASYILTSCCSKTDCNDNHSIPIEFRGFTLDEIDTVYTTGFAANSSFTDTTKETQRDTTIGGDSTYILRHGYFTRSTVVIQGLNLSDLHDWKLYIPAINRTVRIYNYTYNTYRCGGCRPGRGMKVSSLANCNVDDSIKNASNIVIYK